MSIELIIPPLGESISEAVVAKWLKPVGAKVNIDDPLAELETDKVTVTLPAPSAGVLVEQLVQVGASVRVGASIGRIDPNAQPSEAPAATAPAPAAKVEAAKPVAAPAPVAQAPVAQAPVAQAPATQTLRPALSPTTRKHLREQGLDPSAVATAQPAAPVRTATNKPPVLSDGAGPEEVVTLSPLRKRIAERLVEAQHTAAILTTFNEVDMSAIYRLRNTYKQSFVDKHGAKLGFMSFFVKAAVSALKAFPAVNAEIRGDDIVYKKYYDVGVAVGGGKGLVVPVVRGADQLGFAEIEKEIGRLAVRARENKLTLDELTGGTFTISNGGIYGSMLSTPILNPPQTGILGLHNVVERPVAVNGQVEIRPIMYLALSYDHRLVDGREAVQFLVHVKERVEAPDRLLLDV